MQSAKENSRIILEPVQPFSIFGMQGYCVWDPSMIRDEKGELHLFFSRWPICEGFEAWVTHSEVCRARAETPLGPFHFEEVVLPRRPGYWDGDVTHNPSVRCFGVRYYLYYNGNQSEGDWWGHRNNQRVGLAVADRPQGPWTRFDTPLLDVTAGAWDAKVTTNPSCTQTPDGRFILVYKGVGDKNPPPKYGPVLHGVAFADRPEGPFIKHPEPIFASEGAEFPGEDPFVWCRNDRYHVLLKDQGTFYSSSSRAIVHFESTNGIDWELSKQPIVQERELLHSDGHRQPVHRLERPFLYTDNGVTQAFLCGVKSEKDENLSQIVVMGVREEH
jgi:hypothetical protein